MNRRKFLLATTPLIALPLAACPGGIPSIGGVTLTPANIVADIAAAISGLQKIVAGVASVAPTLVPAATLAQFSSGLNTASSLVASVSTSIAASASAPIIAQINAILNGIVNTLAERPLPPPYSTALILVSAILPEIEAFVDPFITAAAPALGGALKAAAPVDPVVAANARAQIAAFVAGM